MPNRNSVDWRVGEPHHNAGLSLKMAFGAIEAVDARIEALLLALYAVRFRQS